MERTQTKLTWLMLSVALFVLPMGLRADSFTNTFSMNIAQAGAVGDTVTFSVTFMNNGISAAYVNGDNFNLPFGLTPDDTVFFNTIAFTQFAQNHSGGGELFTITLDQNLAPGPYTGTFFILGGETADANMANSSFTLGQADFSITVAEAAVPEPSTVILLGSGLLGIAGAFRRRAQVKILREF